MAFPLVIHRLIKASPKLDQIRLAVAVLIPLVTIPALATPLGQRPESVCDVETFMTTNRVTVTIHAEKTSALPWKGQHHVLGVFMIPDDVSVGAPVLLKVKGVGVYCDAATHNGSHTRGVQALPEYHLMVDHIPTRTALWLILQGKFNLIKNSSNWLLSYQKPG